MILQVDDPIWHKEDLSSLLSNSPDISAKVISGASYSIWIPWDAIGGEQKRISLVTSFKSTSGKPIQGIPATMMLPGISRQTETEADEIARMSPQYQRYVAGCEHWRNTKNRPDHDDDSPPRSIHVRTQGHANPANQRSTSPDSSNLRPRSQRWANAIVVN